MPRYTPKTKNFSMPDLVDRFPTQGLPPDGYVITFSGTDGYYYPKPTSKLQIISSPVSSPYNVLAEDVVLVQGHVGVFTVNLPVAPPAGRLVYVKDFAGVANANNINISSAAFIDGGPTHSIVIDYGAAVFVYNGTTWSVLSRF